MSSRRVAGSILSAMIFLLPLCVVNISYAEDVYSLFGKLFLSGRVEYDFTDTRDFLADTEEQSVNQDNFDFDRLFRRGFYSVLTIEETAGNIKNILSLGDIPTQFTSYTFNRDDLTGVRWDVRSDRVDVNFLLVPGPLNPVVGQEEEVLDSGVGLRQVTKFGNSKIGASWYFRQTPVLGLDAETNFANYGLKMEAAITPKSASSSELWDRTRATALLLEGYRTVGDIIVRGEAFRVGRNYDASRSVADNDDQDRYTDNTWDDPPSFIIPGDLDKNDNGIFDYKDDILLFDVDEDFLDESDKNNNGVRDQEENDHDPDYDFDAGLTGAQISMEYKTSRRGISRNLDMSLQYAIRGDRGKKREKAVKAYANGRYRRNILNLGSLVAENELKYVQDDIRDDTWHYAAIIPNDIVWRDDAPWVMDANPDINDIGELEIIGVRNGTEIEVKRVDPVLMQNDVINTMKGTFEYTGVKKMVTTARIKFQYDMDLDDDDQHYEVGIIKTNYRMRPSKSIEIIPMYKYKIRNGFKMAEEKDFIHLLKWTFEGEDREYNVRLRTIDIEDVRDQMHAFILKTVYQFTKTIKITGGLQLLLFNDMKDEEGDFTRQALLGELEKNFVAYEKDLFLHIGVKYINQKAKGIVNDQQFMETFVRVFAKF
ncbi:hypothetical protein ACFL6S_12480 [Candidatus Poribacteria bacterium]